MTKNQNWRSPKTAYILLHFPYLTETFVAEEIQAIRRLGVEVRLVSLLGPGPGPAQPLSEQMLPGVWYAPGILSLSLWRAQIHFALSSPKAYVRLLANLLLQPHPSRPWMSMAKRLAIFLRAVGAAYYLRDEDLDLLHTHFAWLSGAATWVCSRLLGHPFTVTTHAHDIFVSKDLLPLVVQEASHLVTISEYNRRHLESVIGCPARDISVIHCGVNLSLFRRKPAAEAQHRANQPIRILSVGSLQGKKGHAHLIDACQLLQRRGIGFTCSIIGGGPAEAALRRQIQNAGLQKRVQLLGARPHPEIVDAYYQHDLFVLASELVPSGDRDGIPVVLMEAGAAGLPLVSTVVSGIPELVRHDETGLLVAPGDAAALANAMAVLAADPALRERLGRNARALVEAEFSIEKNAPRLVAVFQTTAAAEGYGSRQERLAGTHPHHGSGSY